MTEKTEQEIKDQAALRKRTKEEQEEENKRTERKTGGLTRIIRMIRDNPDLLILAAIVLIVFLAGYWFCSIKLGMTSEQIKLRVWDFIEFVVIVFTGAIALIGKLFVKQGAISQCLSKTASKDSDVSGRSLKG